MEERFDYDGLLEVNSDLRKQLADAQATVDLAKAEGAAEVRKVIQQRLIDVRLARSVARLSFAQDEYDAQISALESILKQCEEPFSSNNENGLDLQATVAALQAQVSELQGIADEKCRCFLERAEQSEKQLTQRTAELEALQRVRDEFERERDQLHAALMEAKAALDAEREKVKGLEAQMGERFKYHELFKKWQAWRDPDELVAEYEKYEAAQTQLKQLQALVRALLDTWVNGRKIHDGIPMTLRQQIDATLDATTPATMDAAETHDRMFNHADRYPEAL